MLEYEVELARTRAKNARIVDSDGFNACPALTRGIELAFGRLLSHPDKARLIRVRARITGSETRKGDAELSIVGVFGRYAP